MIQELSKALEKLTNEQIPFLQISQEAKINYEGLKRISFSKVLVTDFQKIDTIPIASISWVDSISEDKRIQEKLAIWLKTRLKLDTLIVRED